MGYMQQLTLFESLPLLEVKTGNIITTNSVKVEDIKIDGLDKIYKNKYIIHSHGGFHFFKDVEEALPIFKQQIWPWIEVIKETTTKTKRYAMIPRVMPRLGCYSEVTLHGENFNKKVKMHKLVCAAFKINPNPDIYKLVNHINGYKVDHRLENLEWSSHSDNSTGPTIESRLPPDITYKIWSLSLNKKNIENKEIIEINNDN